MARPKEGWKLRAPRRDGESYTVRFRDAQGRDRELSTGTRDPGEAAREAERIYVAELNAAPVEQRGNVDPSLRLDEQLALWLVSLESTHDEETITTYTTYAKRYVQFFGSTLSDVTVAKMGDFQRARLKKVVRSSVRKERSAMNVFLAWCVEQGTLAEDNVPVWPKLPPRAVGTRTGRVREAPVDITAEQARAFVLALPLVSLRTQKGRHFPVRARFVLMAETGLRPATIDGLEMPRHWKPGARDLLITADIDKTRKRRTLPLTPRALAALEAAVEATGRTTGPIFGKHDYRTMVEQARIAAGLPEDFVPYDLRHHFVGFVTDSADARAAMHLAGHTRLTTTNHYVRGREDRSREVLSALGSRGILGEGDLPMSAKDGSRTRTGVTPPEPESNAAAQMPANTGGVEGQEGKKTTPDTPGSWGPPTIQGAAKYLARLRAEWDALDGFVASELLEGES